MKPKDLIGIKLVGTKKRTSNSYGRNLPYMSYKVLCETKSYDVVPLEDVFTAEALKELSYWSKRSNTMAMTCWGTSQLFEAQIALGRFLGFESKGRWSDFSRQCTEFSKAV